MKKKRKEKRLGVSEQIKMSVAGYNDIGKDIEILQRYINDDYHRHLFFFSPKDR